MGKLKAVHLRIEVGCVSEEYDNVRGGMVGFPMRNMGLVLYRDLGMVGVLLHTITMMLLSSTSWKKLSRTFGNKDRVPIVSAWQYPPSYQHNSARARGRMDASSLA